MNEPLVIACPRCRREVLTVTGGPGVLILELVPADTRPGDVCGRCPDCGERACVRVIARGRLAA